MSKFNRIVASILVMLMVLLELPIQQVYAAVTSNTSDELSIDNGYIQYTINKKTGGFSIFTKEGHPQKKYDNNIPLLFQEDSNSTETSFTTIRIDGKDYIFGQDYGWFGIDSKLYDPVVNNTDKTIITTYVVDNVEITQKVAVSTDQDNDLCGNVGVAYEIKNLGNKTRNVGVRTLLDTAIAETDAPYMMVGYESTPTVTEREFSGDDVPDQIRGLNSLNNPTAMSYTILKGWSSGTVPDKVIIAHWANLANTRYDYVPNKNCDFSNYSSTYKTPDSAIAMYWSEQNLAAGDTRKGEFLYGIGNFSSQLEDSNVNLNVTVDRVHVNKDKTGYENDGIFNVKVEVDNSVDGAVKIDNATISLSLQDGLSIVKDKVEGNYDLITEPDIDTGTLEAGGTVSMYWRVKAEPQTTITAKEIGVSLSFPNRETLSTNRYVILPSTTGNLPNVTFDSVVPNKVYAYGDKNISINGNLQEFSALSGKAGWSLYLRHVATKTEIEIEKSNIAFVGETYKTLAISTDKDMPVGDYELVFKFVDEDLVNHFGKEIVVGNKVESCLDERYKNVVYGILTVIRYDINKYKMELIPTEEALDLYREEHNLDSFDCTNQEMLLEIRGRIKKYQEDNGDYYYSADPQQSEVTINNIVQYDGSEPLIIKQDTHGTNTGVFVKGNGKLSVIDHLTFWNSGFKIALINGFINSLEPEKVKLEAETVKNVLIEFTGAGKVLQSIAGFVIDMQYGVLTESWGDNKDGGREGYAINFGGAIAIPFFSLPKSKKDKKNNTSQGGKPDQGSGTATGGDADAESIELANNFFSANIDNILYGESEDEETGEPSVDFIGINTSVGFGLPKNAFGSFIKNSAGVQALLSINTLDNIYSISGGVELMVVTCAGELSIKVIEVGDVKVPVPDTLKFAIGSNAAADDVKENKKPNAGTKPGGTSKPGAGGPGVDASVGIPIIPPFVSLTSIGGGYENLADSITGNYMGSLPPITLDLQAGVSVVEVLQGDMAMSINLQGMNLVGKLGLDKVKNVDFTASINTRWVDPWFLTISGEISIFDIIVGGASITVAKDYFLGHAYVKIVIPNSIPLVGGKSIANAEAFISNTMIGANIKIIGLKFGISYYWDSGDVDISKGKSYAFVDEAPFGNDNPDSVALYGTNIKQLSDATYSTMSRASGGSFADRNDNQVVKAISFGQPSQAGTEEDPDAMLIQIPYTSTNGYIPVAEDITVEGPNGKIKLVQETDSQEGNFMTQDLGEEGKFIFVSVLNSQDINEGSWKITSNNKYLQVQSNFTVSGVDNIPEISNVQVANRPDITSNDLNVSWNFDCDSKLLDNSEVTVYLTDDPNIAINPKDTETLGTILGTYSANEKSETITLPNTLPSGKYYVVTMLNVPDCGPSLKVVSQPITYENTMLPGTVSKVEVSKIGNGMVRVNITENEDEEYTGYNVALFDSNGNEIDNSLNYFDKGNSILLGNGLLEEGKTYKIAVQTINETEDNKYISDKLVYSDSFTMPKVNIPKLTQASSNMQGIQYSNTNEFTARYVFDQDVNLRVLINGVNYINSDEYKSEWDFSKEMKDGDYVVTIEAENKDGDILITTVNENTTSQPFSIQNPILSFTVDTTIPVLKVGSIVESSIESSNTNTVTTTISKQNIELENGRLKLEGVTEAGSNLTLDGSSEGITVQSSGRFTIDRAVDLHNQVQKSMLLSVTDKANNTNATTIYVTDGDIKCIDSLSIKLKNDDGTLSDIPTIDDVKTLKINTGDEINLGVMSKYITNNNNTKELDMSQDNINWSVLYGGNIISMTDGQIKAILPGETVIKASTTSAQFNVDDKEQFKSIEDYFVLKIEGEPQYGKDETAMSDDEEKIYLNKLRNELQKFINATGTENILKTLNVYKYRQESVTITDKLNMISRIQTFDNSDILVVYKPVNANELTLSDSMHVLSDIFSIKNMSGQDHNKPLIFTYDYSQDTVKNPENIGLYKYNELFGKWEYIPSTNNIDGKKIETEIDDFDGTYAFIENDDFIKFTDLDNNWAENYIYRLASLGIINGVQTDKGVVFNPHKQITRAEFIKLVVCAMNVDLAKYSDVELPFKDTNNIESWVLPFIKAAYAENWVNGKESNIGLIIDSSSQISREEAVTILYRIKSIISENDKINFTDSNNISSFAIDAINNFSSLEIINGYSEDNTFRPKVSIKREEAAKIICEWIDKILMQK